MLMFREVVCAKYQRAGVTSKLTACSNIDTP